MEKSLEILKALADETRLKMINLLLTHDYCVRAIAYRLNISEAGISQHLQILRKAGLVRGEKRGYFTHYIVNKEVLKNTAENILKTISTISRDESNYNKKS